MRIEVRSRLSRAGLMRDTARALEGSMLLFGVGLLILFVVAVATGTPSWFNYVELGGGLLGLYAASILDELDEGAAVSSGLLFSVGALALWIIGLATGAPGWMVWLTFVAACQLLAVCLLARAPRTVTTGTTPVLP